MKSKLFNINYGLYLQLFRYLFYQIRHDKLYITGIHLRYLSFKLHDQEIVSLYSYCSITAKHIKFYFIYKPSSYIINYEGGLSLKSKNNIYKKLFVSSFYLSAFTFGGGFVIIPLMKKKFVDELQWIEENEMLNLAAIAQSSPGAVAVNAAILIGYRVAGILGAIITILGTVLPPFIIISVVSVFYTAFRDNLIVNAVLKGMQAGIAAVIADVVINLGGNVIKGKDIISVLIMAGAFISTFYFKINVVYIILVCGFIGAIRTLFHSNKNKKDDNL